MVEMVVGAGIKRSPMEPRVREGMKRIPLMGLTHCCPLQLGLHLQTLLKCWQFSVKR